MRLDVTDPEAPKANAYQERQVCTAAASGFERFYFALQLGYIFVM
jgi:hypothetical protein